MSDEKLVKAFQEAFRNSVNALKGEHDERFYYYAFIFDEGMHPYISAWSEEAYEKSLIDDRVSEEDKGWWKWDYADSPYCAYGYDEYFGETAKFLDERAEGMTEDDLFDKDWYVRMESMEEALKRLDAEGFFGRGAEREKVIVNVEQAPPDGREKERAVRLNPTTALLEDYLEYCEDEEEE
ncbi:DUF4303 domain-containing protein [Ruminococcus sp.]|uniref:DUF4303 domain-containing protein n=1 Tax=Ruminococcus sp. TaxID=41978 RepID=UPI00260105F4|nr:DUF4303 domain-containing protein [Ruminococcus sp.]MBQ8967692.1 DUF4303 domain-containing protein [Ruminococcus sp.]